tara:strand:- start:91 stop:498 length:408 start_codon:yes stop_codon:yes gene_type:complete
MYTKNLFFFLALTMLAGVAQAGTEEEIRDNVKANIAHTNKMMSQDPTRISKYGSKEFFSSGGLLNTIQRDNDASDFEYFSGSVKHIEVVVLVEGQAAVAHYYQEAVMKPQGVTGSAQLPNSGHTGIRERGWYVAD